MTKIDVSLRRNTHFHSGVMRLPSKNDHYFELSFYKVPQIPRFQLLTPMSWNSNRQPLTGRRINRLPCFSLWFPRKQRPESSVCVRLNGWTYRTGTSWFLHVFFFIELAMGHGHSYVKVSELVNDSVMSHKGLTPIAGWFLWENPTKMDENWGYPYFRKPP